MGNVSNFKKVLAIVLAATCMLVFSFSTAFATEASPAVGDPVKGTNSGDFTITEVGESGTASLTGTHKDVKTKVINETISYGGKVFTVTAIGKKAFSKNKSLKVVKIKGTKVTKVAKSAFKGLKVGKIKVKVTKKMSKKNFKTLKAALIKAGIKKKNISRF